MKRLSKFVSHESIGSEPPTEIKLFNVGENPSSKGSVFYEPERAGEMRQLQLSTDCRKSTDGAPMAFMDLAHLSLSDVGTLDAHKAFAWFTIDFADDGIWARDIVWTDEGEALLRSRAFRYFSPAFYVDENDVITTIINVALTNIPASYEILPLVADRKESMTVEQETETLPQVEEEVVELEAEPTMLDAAPQMTPEEMMAALDALKAENAQLKSQLADLQGSAVSDTVEQLSASGLLKDELKEWARTLSYEQLSSYAKVVRSSAKVVTQVTTPAPVQFTKIASRSTGDTESAEDKAIREEISRVMRRRS